MVILLIFAFISGLVTILAPCIWPLLPIILSSSATGGKRKPLGITLGIVISFALFTLTISYIVSVIPFDPNILRLGAVLVIGFLGLTLVIPPLASYVEGFISRFAGSIGVAAKQDGDGFWAGLVTGFSLGIVWSPCAGPILATIAALAATQSVTFSLVLVTGAYVAGLGIPLFMFATFGSNLLTKSKGLSPYTGRIQQVFGVIMILTALAIYTNYDKTIQARLLDAIPAYSQFLYKLEGNDVVRKQLDSLKGKDEDDMNKAKKLMPNLVVPEASLPVLEQAPEFAGIDRWLNSDPLTMADLTGKVVLIDFWTYTCINCIRTLPYVTSWYEKYKDDGLVIVGVHTPEFEFEKKTENVQNAIKQFSITYPVAQDNDYVTWNAYNNHYWPAKYLIDSQGRLRWYHFGEGSYDEAERAIQILLAEKGVTIKDEMTDIPDETPRVRNTPETYMGYWRTERFASPEPLEQGVSAFTLSTSLPLHNFALGGTWGTAYQHSQAEKNSVLELRFIANKVFLVITPTSKNDKIRVLIDGKVVSDTEAGKDVAGGYVKIDTDRLYELIDLKGNRGEYLLRLEFETPGTQIFAFTFG